MSLLTVSLSAFISASLSVYLSAWTLEDDGDLKPTPKSNCFHILYDKIVSKTGIVVKKIGNLSILYQIMNDFS